MFHVKVVSSFLKAAGSLSNLDESKEHVRSGSYMCIIQKQEQAMICNEIKGWLISINFDGTTSLGEPLAVVIRFVSDDWCFVQQLVKLQMPAKCVNEEKLARELISILSVTNSTAPDLLLAAMRCRASINTAALRTVKDERHWLLPSFTEPCRGTILYSKPYRVYKCLD